MALTSKEVIRSLLKNEGIERVGIIGNPWEDTMVKWVRDGYPTQQAQKQVGDTYWNQADGRWLDVTEAGEYLEPVPPYQHFGFDMFGLSPWFEHLPVPDVHKVIEENDQWEIYENGAGARFKYWKHKMGTPEHIAFKMTTRKVWEEEYKPHILEWDPARFDLPKLKKGYADGNAAQKWVHAGHMFIWESMRQSMGDITLYESLLLDPDWIHDYNRTYTDFFKRAFQFIFDEVGLPDGIWLYEDLGYKNGLFASPRTMNKLIFPYFAELVEFFHAHNLPVILHSCGSVAQAMPLIVEAGFDGLNPIERKADGNDPFAFAETYGKDLVFVGGLDVRVLESNDKSTIQHETAALIEGMKAKNARFVFTEDHSIPPTVELESYLWAVDTYRKHCRY